MPHINEERYRQGLAAYRAGHSMRDLINVGEEIERSAEAAMDELRSRSEGGTPEEMAKREEFYKTRSEGMPSLIAGYADGFIDDIRMIARGSGQRRGQTA